MITTWKASQNLTFPSTIEQPIETPANNEVEQVSVLERMLREQSNLFHQSASNLQSSTSIFNIEREIGNLSNCDRLSADSDVLVYWQNKKQQQPELYQLSQIVLAAPSSQVYSLLFTYIYKNFFMLIKLYVIKRHIKQCKKK